MLFGIRESTVTSSLERLGVWLRGDTFISKLGRRFTNACNKTHLHYHPVKVKGHQVDYNKVKGHQVYLFKYMVFVYIKSTFK